jgi:hypothetical protein
MPSFRIGFGLIIIIWPTARAERVRVRVCNKYFGKKGASLSLSNGILIDNRLSRKYTLRELKRIVTRKERDLNLLPEFGHFPSFLGTALLLPVGSLRIYCEAREVSVFSQLSHPSILFRCVRIPNGIQIQMQK